MVHHIFEEGRIVANDPARRTLRVLFPGMKMPRSLSYDYFREAHGRSLPLDTSRDPPDRAPGPPGEAGPEQTEIMPAGPVPARMDGGTEPDPAPAEIVYKAVPIEDAAPEADAPTEEAGVIDGAPEGVDLRQAAPEVLARLSDAENLWKREDVPHSGWICTGVTDLGAPVGVCEMCGHQIIRYAHQMVHPRYRPLVAGCYCAGKMEGDMEAARERERDLKNQQARKESFLRRQWKLSKNGNQYLKLRGHVLVLYMLKNGGWKYAIDSTFANEVFGSREDAVLAAFRALDRLEKGPVPPR